MDITYSALSATGPVRDKNEDFIAFWQPTDPEERKSRGVLVIIADGVGGQGRGDIASRLAVDTALAKFREAKPTEAAQKTLGRMFDAANVAVYDAGMADPTQTRMSTTLTAVLFRNSEVTIGHVGDCRVYRLSEGRLERLTTDHTYASLQSKMGLISEEEAMGSRLRCVLTRNIGQQPFVRADLRTVYVLKGDLILLCSDGLHGWVTEAEMLDVLLHNSPEASCKALIALAERRGTEDNVSVQIARIDRVHKVAYYKGLAFYPPSADPPVTQGQEIQPGQVLDERFEITDIISQGGMATIYKATDRGTQKTVAIKIPMMRFESDPGAFARFEREEAIGRSLSHKYILYFVPVEKKSRPYIVMEYLEGQTLAQLLIQVRPLPVPDALKIAGRIAEALEYMHQNKVIHRDLKPDNIMICNDGSIRIMDFGIARSAESRRITFAGLTGSMGTPDYMAPEQVKGKSGDERTDLYSLGAMLYVMVTGKLPYEGSNAFIVMNSRLTGDPEAPRKVNPAVPPAVEEIILHAMERNPADRYPSAAALRKELEAPESVPLTGRFERLQKPSPIRMEIRRVRVGVIVLIIMMALFGLLFLMSKGGKSDQSSQPPPSGPRKYGR
ncbi:MAG TPA: protein kinase [Planctomycetota bacterium]|nr:protein kinase [Planctomycetota bacterium]